MRNIFNYIDIFNIKKIRYDIIKDVLTWYLLNNRKTLSSVKNISDKRGSTRKIYKQKGMGKARHGSLRAVQFRGGGVSLGPYGRNRYLFKVNNRIKKIALFHAISLKFNTNSIFVINNISFNNYKLNKCIHKNNKKSILFIDINFNNSFYFSTRNLKKINLLKIAGLNTLDIIKHDIVYFSESSFKFLIETYLRI